MGTKSRVSFVVSVLDTRVGRKSSEGNASVREISFESFEIDVDKERRFFEGMNDD